MARGMSKGGTGRKATRTREPEPEQLDIAGTEQQRDATLEREGAKLDAVKQEIAAQNLAKATIEANIHKRFDAMREADPEDPRLAGYRIKSGAVLRPGSKPTLKITRPPSREDKARAKAKGESDD